MAKIQITAKELLKKTKFLNHINSLSPLSKIGMNYFTKEGRTLLKNIPHVIENVWKGDGRSNHYLIYFSETLKKDWSNNIKNLSIDSYREITQSLSEKTLVEHKEQTEQAWITYLNNADTWKKFYNATPIDQHHKLNQIQSLWERHQQFALYSNEFLLSALDAILLPLQHVKDAYKEFTRNKWRLSQRFSADYEKLLKELHNYLHEAKQKIVDAMYFRLDICQRNAFVSTNKKYHVDDVLLDFHQQLSAHVALPPSIAIASFKPWATLSDEMAARFHVTVKRFSKGNQLGLVDQKHWSRNLTTRIFLPSKVASRHAEDEYRNQMNGALLIVPPALKKYLPTQKGISLWLGRQNKHLIRFWEERQPLIARLHRLYPSAIEADKPNDEKIKHYLQLLTKEITDLQNIKLSFFAFTFKRMIKAWQAQVYKLHREALAKELSVIKNAIECAPIDSEGNIDREYSLKINKRTQSIEDYVTLANTFISDQSQKIDISNLKINLKQNLQLDAASTFHHTLRIIAGETTEKLTYNHIEYLHNCIYDTLLGKDKQAAWEQMGDYRKKVMNYLTHWLNKQNLRGGYKEINQEPVCWYIGLVNILGTKEEIAFIQGFFPHVYSNNALLIDKQQLKQEIDASIATADARFFNAAPIIQTLSHQTDQTQKITRNF